jgi:hypothetical protein
MGKTAKLWESAMLILLCSVCGTKIGNAYTSLTNSQNIRHIIDMPYKMLAVIIDHHVGYASGRAVNIHPVI